MLRVVWNSNTAKCVSLFRPTRALDRSVPNHLMRPHIALSAIFSLHRVLRVSPFTRTLTATFRRIGFVSCGPVFHLPLLSTLSRGIAVTFYY